MYTFLSPAALASLRSPRSCQSGSLCVRASETASHKRCECFLRAMASSYEQESFRCGWEGEKSSMPVTPHQMAFSQTNASSVRGAGHDGYNNIRSIYFP